MQEKYGFVYIWYDRKHKRYYVGCRWGSTNDGYVCSSKWMKQAYGHRPNDFKRRILKSNISTRQQTFIEEQRYLDMIKPTEIKIRYYNLNIKNNKLWHSYDETMKTIGQKISAAKKGKSTGPCSPEKAAAISAAKKAKNRKFTDEHREKIRQAKLGTKQSAESRQKKSDSLKLAYKEGRKTYTPFELNDSQKAEKNTKISESLKGRHLSDEHKQKIIDSGFGTFWVGKSRSDETKLKMAEARKMHWIRRKSNII